MEHIDYNNEKVINVIKKAELKGEAQRNCINDIDLSSIDKKNLGEAKYNYNKCMKESGYEINDYSTKHTNINRY